MSRYPSPNERAQVRRLIAAGADLVVCTGSHFFKGFITEAGKPVIYGIGNHLFSYGGEPDTEPIGTHLVAGFSLGKLAQLFIVPFHNNILATTGPLNDKEFAEFRKTFRERSTTDSSKYFSDPGSLRSFKYYFSQRSISDFSEVKARHIVYGARILLQHYPFEVVATVFAILSLPIGFFCLVILRRNRHAESDGTTYNV
jgi:hypothetical protein